MHPITHMERLELLQLDGADHRDDLALDDVTIALGAAARQILAAFDPRADVRSVLGPFAQFAEDHEVGVWAVTHPAKGAGANALNAFIGSVGYIAAARLGFVAVDEQDSERKLLLAVKTILDLSPQAEDTSSAPSKFATTS